MTRRRVWIACAVFAAALVAFLLLRPRAIAPESIERLPAYHDASLLKQAWALPVARRYGPGGYLFQANPSTCGPASIANVLRSEGRPLAPDAVLAGSSIHMVLGYLPRGLTLDQEAGLLRLRTGKPVGVLRGLSLADFRRELLKSNDPAWRLIVNFTRAPLFGRGHGHFSPILGYLPGRDLVFIGDVNADYRPWLVPAARLYAAQDSIDDDSQRKRGLLEVAAR